MPDFQHSLDIPSFEDSTMTWLDENGTIRLNVDQVDFTASGGVYAFLQLVPLFELVGVDPS